MIQTKIILSILILVVLSIYIFYLYFEGFQNPPSDPVLSDPTLLKNRILILLNLMTG